MVDAFIASDLSSLLFPSEANPARYSVGTLDMNPPSHLKKDTDDHILESFFGTEQVDKLNQFKKSISVDSQEANQLQGNSNKKNPRPKIPVNPNLGHGFRPSLGLVSNKFSASSPLLPSPAVKRQYSSEKREVVGDVVSEMQKLRLRLQETTRQELAEIDRKYSPKLSHQGLFGSDLSGQGNHARQGSLDDSSQATSQPITVSHVRYGSVPVDPSKLLNDTNFKASSISPHVSSERLGFHHGSPSLERSRSSSSRSPTPPLQYGHIRQRSTGSVSSGNMSFSPPPVSGTISPLGFGFQYPPLPVQRQQSPPDMQQGGGGRAVSPKPFTIPPSPNRASPPVHNQQPPYPNSFKQPLPTATGKPPPIPAKMHRSEISTAAQLNPPTGQPATRLSPPATQFNQPVPYSNPPVPQSVAPPHPGYQRKPRSSQTTGRMQSKSRGDELQQNTGYQSTGSLGSKRPSSARGRTHYSTDVIGRRRRSGDSNKLPLARSVDDIPKHQKEQPQEVRNGYPRTAADSPLYDRLMPPGSRSSSTSPDQSEQKNIPKTHRSVVPPSSNRMHRSPPPLQPLTADTTGVSRLANLPSAPNVFSNENSAAVYPEDIQPYMTSRQAKSQFVYTPFSQDSKTHGSIHSNLNSTSTSRKLDKNNPLTPAEQTWC